MDRARWPGLRAAALACLAAAGCFAREKPDLNSPDAALKIPAIKSSVRQHDPRAIAALVKDLDSDDPAVRFYAIEGLRRMTGQTFDYRYYDDEIRRKPAVKAWHAWLAHEQGSPPATTEPSTKP